MASVHKSVPVPELTDAMYAQGRTSHRLSPFDVVAARYSRAYDALQLTLRNEFVVRLPRRRIRELAKALPADLAKVEIQPGGDGITFRSIDVDIDVDISVPGLLADELGSLFARAMGRKTKGRTSTAKVAASRQNGRKGGRPRKPAA